MNEKKFQEFLEENFQFSYGVGIGDDASITKQNGLNLQVITKDILLENIHFKMDYFTLEKLAKKAVAVNLSDIAAMGAVPQYFYLGLGLPKVYQKDIKCFFDGIKKICSFYNINLAGGDYSNSELIFISITMVGKCKNPVLRKNANKDDLICITKNPGESALGLKLLQKKKEREMTKFELFFSNKHKNVNPEIKKGQILNGYVNSMLDISDGLTKDLNRILSASNKGAVIDYKNIPVSDKFKLVCDEHNIKEEDLVLGGGEDYSLLFTISKEKELLLNKKDIKYSIIGNIINDKNLIIIKDSKPLEIKPSGYDHFV